MKVIKYHSDWSDRWNAFVRRSSNGTFHVERGFIEYHGDRFTDHSLMVVDEKETILCVLPLNVSGQQAYSHQGLTYAGFIVNNDRRIEEKLEMFQMIFNTLREEGIEQLYYKTIPHIYHVSPCEDDLYFLFLIGAKSAGKHVNPTINRQHVLPFQERRTRGVKKASKEGVQCAQSEAWSEYWEILTQLLGAYGTKPVHSLEEINRLRALYPENIKLFTAHREQKILAGIVVFESATVSKFQYIASSDEGKQIGALDLLTSELIHQLYKDKLFIDFGTSTLSAGKELSVGISNQKEGFGARTTVHEHFSIDLKNIDWQLFEQATS